MDIGESHSPFDAGGLLCLHVFRAGNQEIILNYFGDNHYFCGASVGWEGIPLDAAPEAADEWLLLAGIELRYP